MGPSLFRHVYNGVQTRIQEITKMGKIAIVLDRKRQKKIRQCFSLAIIRQHDILYCSWTHPCQYFYRNVHDQFQTRVHEMLSVLQVQKERHIPCSRRTLTDVSQKGLPTRRLLLNESIQQLVQAYPRTSATLTQIRSPRREQRTLQFRFAQRLVFTTIFQ